MTIKISSIEMMARVPQLPKTLPVVALTIPSLEERRQSVLRLAEQMQLGTMKSAQLEHGLVMASERGDITVFHASGGVWARNAILSKGDTTELRQWAGVVDSKIDGQRMAFAPEVSRKLSDDVRELLAPLGLIGREALAPSVQLDQVAQLDAKGTVVSFGAGQATVRFEYALGEVPVRGAGAKTLAFAEPAGGRPAVGGVFHVWRTPAEAVDVKIDTVEAALAVGLLEDPELDRHAAAGHRITVTKLEFVYLALPAFMRQSHLFPAFQIEGEVSEGKLGMSFHFGRYHHAVSPKAYAAAGLHGQYLATNPDGLTPKVPRSTSR